jgi:hypothetical protein
MDPPSEQIFLGAPPFFGQKYLLMTHPFFLQVHQIGTDTNFICAVPKINRSVNGA